MARQAGLNLEPDTSPYTGTTLTVNDTLIDGSKFVAAGSDYWYTHYSYGVDLGVGMEVFKIHCSGLTASGTPTSWYSSGYDSFSVYKSDDNSTWTLVESFDGPPLIYLAAQAWTFELALATPATARYWKVVYTDSTTCAFLPGGLSGKIGEVEVFTTVNYDARFANRIKIDIDPTNVDSPLTNFPVCLPLGTSVGIGNDDVSAIFDELTSDANRKKIAVTGEDGVTECYVEIEYWDDATETAVLWVKVPNISDYDGAILYLYYDSTADANTDYVGDIGDAAAQVVWDSDFVLVCHMAQDPSGGAGAMKDSTSNANNGTSGGTMLTGDLVAGKVGQCLDFDGTDDYIDFGSDTTLDDLSTYTVEASIKLTGWGSDAPARIMSKSNADLDGWQLIADQTNGLTFGCDWQNGTFAQWYETTPVLSALTTWYNVAITLDNTSSSNDPVLYVDGAASSSTEGQAPSGGTPDADASYSLYVAARNNSGTDKELYGLIDEVRISKIERSAAWLKATYHSNNDNFVTYGSEKGWLGTWAYRLKVVISSDNIDSTLTDFPVKLYLSTASGTFDADDVSAIFDELTSDANRKKIAVTSADGTTQLYVEIEKWDDASEKAQLWVKVPSISSTADTVLYFYYDSAQSDNTTYVGDTDSTPAQSVWDANYVLVYHMNQDPNGDGANAIKDSTSNNNDGTPAGSMTTADLVADPYGGNAIDFDGTDDEINLTTMISDASMTVEIFCNPDAWATWTIFCGKDSATTDFWGYYTSSNYTRVRANNTDADITEVIATGAWVSLAAILDGTNFEFVEDGVSEGSTGQTQVFDIDVVGYGFTTTAYHFNGKMAEFRVSDSARSVAWCKATHFTTIDEVLTYFGVETYIEVSTYTVDFPYPMDISLAVSGVPGVGIPFAAPMDIPIAISISLVGFEVACPSPLPVTVGLSSAGVTMIGRDLWAFNSFITKLHEENSPIEKVTEKDSRITKIFKEDSSLR